MIWWLALTHSTLAIMTRAIVKNMIAPSKGFDPTMVSTSGLKSTPEMAAVPMAEKVVSATAPQWFFFWQARQVLAGVYAWLASSSSGVMGDPAALALRCRRHRSRRQIRT
jgi:hypothetical protein